MSNNVLERTDKNDNPELARRWMELAWYEFNGTQFKEEDHESLIINVGGLNLVTQQWMPASK